MIAYLRKGHIKVEILKYMDCGFYKCRIVSHNNNRKRDIYINDLETKDKQPIRPETLQHLPKLWKDK